MQKRIIRSNIFLFSSLAFLHFYLAICFCLPTYSAEIEERPAVESEWISDLRREFEKVEENQQEIDDLLMRLQEQERQRLLEQKRQVSKEKMESYLIEQEKRIIEEERERLLREQKRHLAPKQMRRNRQLLERLERRGRLIRIYEQARMKRKLTSWLIVFSFFAFAGLLLALAWKANRAKLKEASQEAREVLFKHIEELQKKPYAELSKLTVDSDKGHYFHGDVTTIRNELGQEFELHVSARSYLYRKLQVEAIVYFKYNKYFSASEMAGFIISPEGRLDEFNCPHCGKKFFDIITTLCPYCGKKLRRQNIAIRHKLSFLKDILLR